MKDKIEIKSINGDVLFSLEKENNTIKDTLEQAVREGADLRDANLEYADLRDADLRNANLRDANLKYVDLSGANLRIADLRHADLKYTNLICADLRNVDLRDAKNIPNSYINQCSQQMLYIFQHLKHEIPKLREKIIVGEIEGTQYEGECCCLIGTLGNGNMKCIEKTVSNIPYYDKGLHNPAEQWFFQIRKGDTPENNFFAEHALKLIDSILEAEN